MQYPPSGPNWPPQDQPPDDFGQQPFSPGMQYPIQQDQWGQVYGQPYIGPDWQPQQPPRRSRRGLWIVLAIVAALVVFGCVGASFAISQAGKSANTAITNAQSTVTNAQSTVNGSLTQVATVQATAAPTQAATQPASGNWKTTQTFTGNGVQKTGLFTVPGDWKILFSCTPESIAGVTTDAVLVVTVYGSDNSVLDVAVNATCKTGVAQTTGSTEEHQGGQIYLSIDGTSDWTIQVQEPK